VKELYDAEPAEVKAEVAKRRDEGFSDNEEEDNEDVDDDDKAELKRRANAASFQRCVVYSHAHIDSGNLTMAIHSAQDCLGLTMARMLEQVEKECGMVGTVLLGGPEPRRGGKVVVVRYEYIFLLWEVKSWLIHSTSYHSRRTPRGYDFSQSLEDWKKTIENPFIAFVNKVFSKLQRQQSE